MDFQSCSNDSVHRSCNRTFYGGYDQAGVPKTSSRGFWRVCRAISGGRTDNCDIGNQAEDFGLVMVKIYYVNQNLCGNFSPFRDKIEELFLAYGGFEMAVKYDKLFDILKERKIKAVELQKAAGFSGNIMTRIRRNEYVSLESIEKICQVLDCKMDDLIDFE